jgi:renalase
MRSEEEIVRIAIIGAGLSGLACARQLSAGGFEVVIFDKGRHPGGRLSSRERQPQFDYGAQYLTVTDQRFEENVADWREDWARHR